MLKMCRELGFEIKDRRRGSWFARCHAHSRKPLANDNARVTGDLLVFLRRENQYLAVVNSVRCRQSINTNRMAPSFEQALAQAKCGATGGRVLHGGV
jgi:hypothetical protein